MATYFELPLWIDWDDVLNRAAYFKNSLGQFDSGVQDAILQWVHDFLYLSGDASVSITFKDGTTGGSPGSSHFARNGWDTSTVTANVRGMQINLGAWAAAATIDNPAGTGSLSGVSIDAFSVSNTMAKNNATAEDVLNFNQYGSSFMLFWNRRFDQHIMI